MQKNPIGVFDSGYGGLTILKEMVQQLPQYDYLYLGDNARAPYGSRDFETVYAYTLEAVKWFFRSGCDLVILACNTASAKALRSIQQQDLPLIAPEKRVLGVIRPTSEIIGNLSRNGHVGVLGTTGTIHSESYLIEIGKFFPALKVSQEACPEWVDLVESNLCESPEANQPVAARLSNILQKDPQIDTLLLACTHYPLLLNKIKAHLPETIEVIAQGEIVAQSLKTYLHRHPELENKLSRTGTRTFFTTGSMDDFEQHGSQFFGANIQVSKTGLP